MGRSSRSQAEQNRARIVAAATGLFRRRGVAAVSIADIMAAAGMTQGGFYKHFPSKDALAAEACTTAFARSEEAWKEAARQEDDGGKDALRDLVTYYFAPKPPEKTCPMIALGQDAATGEADQPLREAYREGARRLFEAFGAAAETNAATALPRERVVLLFAAMVGANLLARAAGGASWVEDMQEIVRRSVDM